MPDTHTTDYGTLYNADNIEILKTMADNSIDAIVTDPPYAIKLMNKKWDNELPSVEFWTECLRILKPGGHLLSACGTRTYHRATMNIDNAGFEIRDAIAWIYSVGLPKSMDISKAIDRELGAERKQGELRTDGKNKNSGHGCYNVNSKDQKGLDKEFYETLPATNEAKEWDGWRTCLKPSMELWTLARKPIAEKNMARNKIKYRTGGLNIDKCRITNKELKPYVKIDRNTHKFLGGNHLIGKIGIIRRQNDLGRFPSNVIIDDSDDVVSLFPGIGNKSASRFFYCAKASEKERSAGVDGRNTHLTVKPLSLMMYLCNLITPPNGIVLDPFIGSGSTAIACIRCGFKYIGIEIEEEYFNIAKQRIEYEIEQERFL